MTIRKSLWAVPGLCLIILLGVTPNAPLPTAAADDEPLPQKEWTAAEIEKAGTGQIVCAWKQAKAADVVKVCQDLGFEVLHEMPLGDGVVCRWKGKLNADKLAELNKHQDVKYVEPVMARSVQPEKGIDLKEERIEFKPVYTPDTVLPALKEAKALVCGWREGFKYKVVEQCKALGLTVEPAVEGKSVVCRWTGELKQEVIDKLSEHPGVAYIEPPVKREGFGGLFDDDARPAAAAQAPAGPFAVTPGDPKFGDQFGLLNIGGPVAWKSVQTSPIIVAVCDTGVDYTHEDLQANMWRNPKSGAADIHGADFIDPQKNDSDPLKVVPGSDPKDQNFHGTHVAGIIGAVGNNGVGIAGVCWRVQLMAVRCLGKDGSATSVSVGQAINYAADNGAKVINLSLGGRGAPVQHELDIIKKARDKGCLLVIAAGNRKDDEIDNDKRDIFPANYTKFVDNIIAVANTDSKDQLNSGSHFGKKTVHLAAPGTNILSTMPMQRTPGFDIEEKKARDSGRTITIDTKYMKLNGTSMAAPHVAGAVALMLGHPKFSELRTKPPLELKQALLGKVKLINGLGDKTLTGGLLDIGFLGESAAPTPTPIPPGTPLPPPIRICPQYPRMIPVCPPVHQCPQYPERLFPRSRR